jgi:hydroxyacylglutathione hydrolase
MFIQQLYTSCLSEAAYYIEDNGEAAIIDPLRDTGAYTALAAERKTSIRYIFETHFHADFVSGHLDLQQQTGAPIVYGPSTVTNFPSRIARDGERFAIGQCSLEVLHTPGHTLESVCYLLRDAEGKPHCVFTGDTLFVGDVGRPDLSSGDLTPEALAGMLHDSLEKHIKPLPDEVIVYPAHGPGSACGKNIGPDAFSTIGEQRQSNYALLAENKEAFVKAVTEGLAAPPGYFFINARINKEGYSALQELIAKGMKPLSVAGFKKRRDASEEAIVLDTRNEDAFTEGFIPGSVFIGLNGRYAEWAGSLLPYDKPVLLVTEPGREEESIVRLARVGLDRVEGFLDGGYDAWTKAGEAVDMIITVEADELAMDIPFDDRLLVVDVRKETEFADGHVEDALNLPLGDLTDPGSMASLEEDQNLYVHCAGGYRSVIACSLLKKQGFHNLRNVMGGWSKISEQKGIPIAKDSKVLN